MKKWADYLISEVNYDSKHLISVAIRHQDTDKGITVGIPVDRLTISSDIKNGLSYTTIYHGNNSWKKGKVIQTFFIDGTPYLRLDENKVNLDYLGDLPNSSIVIEEPTQELESLPEPAVETAPSSKGSLPKESAEELPQELELLPEPAVETQDEEVTPEQLSQVNNLEHQIDELEDILFSQLDPTSEGTPEQLSKIKELEKEIEKLETVDLEHEIIQTLQNQNEKLDNIEKKLSSSTTKKSTTKKSTTSDSLEAYCVKCKTKRKIKNPTATVMKNGRDAVKGSCSICDCNVFRIGKMKK